MISRAFRLVKRAHFLHFASATPRRFGNNRLQRFNSYEANDCRYEMTLNKFKKERQHLIENEYLLFLQEMRQYFFRGAYDLYNANFMKTILTNSMKRNPEYQLSSIVYFRKKRRHLTYDSNTDFYLDVKDYMDDFYTMRNEEIQETFKDLCLEYDNAARVILRCIEEGDFELFTLLHDNRPYTLMLPSVTRGHGRDSSLEKGPLADLKYIVKISMNELKEHQLLSIDSVHFEEAHHWTVFQANILTIYDKIYKQTGQEEEDLKKDGSLKELLQSEEKLLWNRVKDDCSERWKRYQQDHYSLEQQNFAALEFDETATQDNPQTHEQQATDATTVTQVIGEDEIQVIEGDIIVIEDDTDNQSKS